MKHQRLLLGAVLLAPCRVIWPRNSDCSPPQVASAETQVSSTSAAERPVQVVAQAKATKGEGGNQHPAGAAQGKPNILVIFGDDIGISKLSAYSDGLMGYSTPNIDRIAKEGIDLHRLLRRASCTAGRSSFLTGQSRLPHRPDKVGFPGAPMGMSQHDPTIGGCSRTLAMPPGSSARTTSATATSPCRRSMASTSSSATSITSTPRKSPNCRTYPQRSRVPQKFGPRGVLKCKATDKDDPTVDPRFGKSRQADHRGYRPARPRSGWRRSTTRPRPRPSTT